jgi:hypothetical protein
MCLKCRGGCKESKNVQPINILTYRKLTSSVGEKYRTMSEGSDGGWYSCLEELSGSVSDPTMHEGGWLAKSRILPD